MGKMKTKSIVLLSLIIILALTSCGLADLISDSPDEGQVQETETKVVKDLATATMKAPLPTPSDTGLPPVNTPLAPGMITGQLSFPSEYIPPLRIIAFDVDDLDKFYALEVTTGDTYVIEVPAGTYIVLSYMLDPDVGDPDFAGGYSEFVLCGLEVGCEDHSLVPVEVQPGETVSDIDLADWYLPMNRSGEWPSNPFGPEIGTIRGHLGFPSEYIPPLLIVAFDTTSQEYYTVETQSNQTEYEMDLPPGTYHVLAYVQEEGSDFVGGYSVFVTCGLSVDCTDHSLIDVVVIDGEITEDVDPVDFYVLPDEVDWPENPCT